LEIQLSIGVLIETTRRRERERERERERGGEKEELKGITDVPISGRGTAASIFLGQELNL
jgi:hypothetical protein